LISTPGEPIFQQAAQKLVQIIPAAIGIMNPAAKSRLRTTERNFIVGCYEERLKL
jgi:hypothetical protein